MSSHVTHPWEGLRAMGVYDESGNRLTKAQVLAIAPAVSDSDPLREVSVPLVRRQIYYGVEDPALTEGTEIVLLVSPGERRRTSTISGWFAPAEIVSLTPAEGATSGGDTVVVGGVSLDGVTAVTVGGNPVGSLVITDFNHLQFVTPAATDPGAAAIVITDDSGTHTSDVAFTYTGVAGPDPVGQGPGVWDLVFRDEFDGTALDTTKWYGWLPEELPSNSAPTEVESTDLAMSQVVVSGGQAVATATPGVFAGAPDPLPSGQSPQYKSWMMSTAPRHPDHTSPGFAAARAYWEVRFRLGKPDGSNLTNATHAWPAMWGIAVDGLWGDLGAPEIDMLEQFDGSWRTSYWHEDQPDLSGPAYTHATDELTIADGFHTLAVTWTDSDVWWYLDGVEMAHYAGTVGDVTDLPVVFMTNMAVRVGALADAHTDFSVTYDYVRIWRKAGAPAKPAITSVTPGDGQITVTFGAVTGAVSYRAFAAASRPATESMDSQRHADQPRVSGTGTTLVIPNVTNGKHYRVAVEAIDSTDRHSVCSNLSAEVVPATTPAPNAPTIGAATAGAASATVAFTPASTGATATGFVAISTPGGHTGTGTSSPITVSGLTDGTAYTFTVHATNSGGDSAESASSNSVTPSGGGGGSGTTLLADTFTRANASGLGTAETGGAWIVPGTNFSISSGKAVATPGGGFTTVTLDAGTGHSDGTLTVDMDATTNTGIDTGVILRRTDDTHLIWLDVGGAGGHSYVAKLFVRDGSTSFTGISALWNFTASSDTWSVKVELSGSSITVSVDTGSGFTVLGTGTDTTGQAGTEFGLAQNGTGADPHFDNFLLTT